MGWRGVECRELVQVSVMTADITHRKRLTVSVELFVQATRGSVHCIRSHLLQVGHLELHSKGFKVHRKSSVCVHRAIEWSCAEPLYLYPLPFSCHTISCLLFSVLMAKRRSQKVELSPPGTCCLRQRPLLPLPLPPATRPSLGSRPQPLH